MKKKVLSILIVLVGLGCGILIYFIVVSKTTYAYIFSYDEKEKFEVSNYGITDFSINENRAHFTIDEEANYTSFIMASDFYISKYTITASGSGVTHDYYLLFENNYYYGLWINGIDVTMFTLSSSIQSDGAHYGIFPFITADYPVDLDSVDDIKHTQYDLQYNSMISNFDDLVTFYDRIDDGTVSIDIENETIEVEVYNVFAYDYLKIINVMTYSDGIIYFDTINLGEVND